MGQRIHTRGGNKDLRNDSFDIFREQAVKSKRMDEPDIQVSNEQLLDRLNLINEGLLTRAAILLFHHNPEKWIPGSYVKIAYFQKIKDSCILAGNDIPEYKVKREDITVTFKSLYNKSTQDNTQDESLTIKERQILNICKEEKSKQEIANLMGYKTIKSIKPEIESLLKKRKLKMSIPDKPKSKNQKYIAAKDKNID